MPFDQGSFVETKPDVFSLEGLIAWLEKQPADQKYVWFSFSGNCNGGRLIHQYLRANDRHPTYDYDQFAKCAGGRRADTEVAMRSPHTFGAALERALALQSKGRA